MNIQEFAAIVEKQQRERYIKSWEGFNPNDEDKNRIVKLGTKTTVKEGKKYTKVDVGQSGKFMVVNETGEIFGIKAYGVINKNKPNTFGTLATVNEWNWGEYKPFRLETV